MLLRKFLIASALLLALILPSFLPIAGRERVSVREIFSLEMLEVQAQGAFTPGNAFGNLAAAAQTASSTSSSLEGMAQKFFAGVLEVFSVLNWITLSGAQALLDPDIIFGTSTRLVSVPVTINIPGISNLTILLPVRVPGPRPMEGILHSLWFLSRNIVNAIFAFILIAGAIYMIIGAGGEGMSKIKQAAPKFVLAVILVNFSWFFPRVILDVSSVLSSVIYQIPSLAGPMSCTKEVTAGADKKLGTSDDVKIPCDFVWKLILFPPTKCNYVEIKKGCPRPQMDFPPPFKGRQISDLLDVYYEDWGKVATNRSFTFGGTTTPVSGADLVLNGLAVNFAKIPSFGIVAFQKTTAEARGADGVVKKGAAYVKLLVEMVLHSILSIAVGLALLALFVVLIVRVGGLWLCIAFMPFIFVGVAMGKTPRDIRTEGAPQNLKKIFN